MDNMGEGDGGNVMEQEEWLWRGKKSEAGVRLTHLHNKRLTSGLVLGGLSFSSSSQFLLCLTECMLVLCLDCNPTTGLRARYTTYIIGTTVT